MTNHGPADDGAISDIPWASVFDPVVNVRALGEIQARGFRAATDLVDRFVRSAPAQKSGTASPVNAEAQPVPNDGRAAPDAEHLLGAWQQLMGQAVQSLRGVGLPGGDAAFDFTRTAATGHVHLASRGTATASAEVWLHNSGSVDVGKVRLRCSDLLAHDGALIGADAVRFEPDTVPMVARSSRGVTVEIDIGDDVLAGWYRGTLLADGFPDMWLPIALHIASPAE